MISMDDVLVIDIGGTKTNLCIASRDKEILLHETKKINTAVNPEHHIQQIKNDYLNFKKQPKIASLSLPGFWDKSGKLVESYFLHSWLNFPFIDTLKKELNLKECVFETDVICGGLGEYRAHNYKKLLYLNIGTGIGASLIEDGKPYKSSAGLTLRMQKLVFPFQEEIYSAVDLISGGTISQGTKFATVEELFEGYKKADVEAIDLISRAQTQLACWLINLFYLFAPEIIVLNGGLTYDFDVLASGAIDIAKEELEDNVDIIQSKLKELAPIHGAFINMLTTILK
ncbi:MAG: ROK family protein [Candidatus Melainabacteria bacterium]|nr:ROK family protein [Candidatus Melainabacteria bacterium]MBI3308383.1 ROK family protein [Candidatus Melainabacteria bacterium]